MPRGASNHAVKTWMDSVPVYHETCAQMTGVKVGTVLPVIPVVIYVGTQFCVPNIPVLVLLACILNPTATRQISYTGLSGYTVYRREAEKETTRVYAAEKVTTREC